MLALIAYLLAGCGGGDKRALKKSSIALSSSQVAELNERSREQWRNILHWPDPCEVAFNFTHAGSDSGIEYYASAGKSALVSVLCAAGAYQPSFRYYLTEALTIDTAAVPVQLPTYQSHDGIRFESERKFVVWGEPNFIEETGELVILSVSRQTGDCGTWTRYRLNGTQAELQGVWARLPCPKEIQEPADPVSVLPPAGWKRVKVN